MNKLLPNGVKLEENPGHKHLEGRYFEVMTRSYDGAQTLVVLSGYFNPFHIGHLRMFQAARRDCDRLCVIVNNDAQQLMKKGCIIMPEAERIEIVRHIKLVDEAILSIDDDRTVRRTLAQVAENYKGWNIIFGNGGDRTDPTEVPEYPVCLDYGIDMIFDYGGNEKLDSSTRINRILGREVTPA